MTIDEPGHDDAIRALEFFRCAIARCNIGSGTDCNNDSFIDRDCSTDVNRAVGIHRDDVVAIDDQVDLGAVIMHSRSGLGTGLLLLAAGSDNQK